MLRRRWRLAALALLALVAVQGDGAVRYHAMSVAVEWGNCLFQQRPPPVQHDLIIAARLRTSEPRAVRHDPADVPPPPLPTVNPRDGVPSSPVSTWWPGSRLADVRIAVIDSGLDVTHPAFANATILPGIDLISPCGKGHNDVSGHGTAVAGVIASNQHGMAPQVEILPVRTSLATGTQLRWITAAAIVWATDNGADVINLSRAAQSAQPSDIQRAAVQYATERGVVLVAAAGNDPLAPAGYPAAYPEVISVTAVDAEHGLSAFAARRGAIDIAAPGSRVETLALDGGYRAASGTSLATPIVAAAAAHLKALNPELGPDEIRVLLRETATDLPSDLTAGADRPFGVLDLPAALREAVERMEELQVVRVDRVG